MQFIDLTNNLASKPKPKAVERLEEELEALLCKIEGGE
jgi:hypothetical protein